MSTNKRAARAVADLSQGMILAVVEIEVPPERVFRALTNPDELVHWWGSPDTYQVTASTMDLRIGGQWSTTGRGADGAPFMVSGEFLEIVPPHRLVQTWKPAWDGGHTTTIRYQLDPIATGTRVTVRHEGFGERRDSCAGHAQGWEQVLGWLGRHFVPQPAAASGAAAAPSPTKTFFFCRLLPPRPTFAFDMTPDERKIMLAHSAYWREHLAKGTTIVFGPVADPKGGWGLGVVRAASEAEVRAFERQDPVILADLGFSYEVTPMLTAVFRE
jgi:uncharacterized protein YndB with AHSA1/START domain